MDAYEQLGERLTLIRERVGMSRSEVARGLGLAREGYIGYETGRVRLPLLLIPALADIFGMPKLTLARALGIVEEAEAPSFEDWFLDRQRDVIASMPPPPSFNSRLEASNNRRRRAVNHRTDGDSDAITRCNAQPRPLARTGTR